MHRKYVLSRFALKTHACLESRYKVISPSFNSPNIYSQDRTFDCVHIPYDCNDIAIQTVENKKSRLQTQYSSGAGVPDEMSNTER